MSGNDNAQFCLSSQKEGHVIVPYRALAIEGHSAHACSWTSMQTYPCCPDVFASVVFMNAMLHAISYQLAGACSMQISGLICRWKCSFQCKILHISHHSSTTIRSSPLFYTPSLGVQNRRDWFPPFILFSQRGLNLAWLREGILPHLKQCRTETRNLLCR